MKNQKSKLKNKDFSIVLRFSYNNLFFATALILFFVFVFFPLTTYAKKVVSVGATISETSDQQPPPSEDPTGGDFQLSCPQSFEISSLNTVSRLSIPSLNIIIKPGGKIKSLLNNIRLDTDCDLIVLEGGEIYADGESGGFITLSVGGNMKIAGKITAKGMNGAGGFLRFDTGKDLVLDGDIDVSGVQDGGFIRGDIKGNLKIKNNSMIANGDSSEGGSMRFMVGGNLISSGSFTANGKNGGFLRIDTNGDANISGTISVNGDIDGGQIRFSAKGAVSISGNSFLANGINGGGGIITLDSLKKITVSGLYSANGKNGGSLMVSSNDDISILSSALISAIGINGNGGSISLKTAKKLTINGELKATGSKSQGKISLSYCSKDFSGAFFDPAPEESVSCFAASSPNTASQTIIPKTNETQTQNQTQQNQNFQAEDILISAPAQNQNITSKDSNQSISPIPPSSSNIKLITPSSVFLNFQPTSLFNFNDK